jgi:hypothetical protein
MPSVQRRPAGCTAGFHSWPQQEIVFQPPIECVREIFLWRRGGGGEGNRPGLRTDHSPPSSLEFKNCGAQPQFPHTSSSYSTSFFINRSNLKSLALLKSIFLFSWRFYFDEIFHFSRTKKELTIFFTEWNNTHTDSQKVKLWVTLGSRIGSFKSLISLINWFWS